MTRLAVLALLLPLYGCPTTVPKEVRIPVPVPCVREIPVGPETFEEPALLELDRYQFTIGLDADRRAWRAHARQLEAALIACKGGAEVSK